MAKMCLNLYLKMIFSILYFLKIVVISSQKLTLFPDSFTSSTFDTDLIFIFEKHDVHVNLLSEFPTSVRSLFDTDGFMESKIKFNSLKKNPLFSQGFILFNLETW